MIRPLVSHASLGTHRFLQKNRIRDSVEESGHGPGGNRRLRRTVLYEYEYVERAGNEGAGVLILDRNGRDVARSAIAGFATEGAGRLSLVARDRLGGPRPSRSVENS